MSKAPNYYIGVAEALPEIFLKVVQARRMLDTGVTPTVALGFRTAKDAFYLEEFAALGCSLSVAT